MNKTKYFLSIVSILAFCNGCAEYEFSENEKKIITEEIQNRLKGYPEALKNKDMDWFRNFWSNDTNFVFAGDGEIATDYESFIQELENVVSNQKEVLHFKFTNDNVNVYSKNVVSYVVNFDWGMVYNSGDTLRSKGSWLYVFKKSNDQWSVVHSAGTHNLY